MPFEAGGRIGGYRIESQLGQGGMGTVYRAFDTTLQRPVAIKVLSEADEQAGRKLLQEARSASTLSHPNIATVHEVGEHDGQPYIVMELVEGKALAELIPSDGLPPENVICYGLQIADALAHAHEHGIVHRDLKSLNVVITPEGRAKVLDFGLATRLAQQDAEAVTVSMDTRAGPGRIAGTLAYMAPEVLRGEAATAWSDIWALGVVLYEMASGQLPFTGATQTDVVSSIVKESPPPLPTRTSAGLRSIIQRCLAKQTGQRYSGAAVVQGALETVSPTEAVAGPTAVSNLPRLVVRPFKTRGGDAELTSFAEGLTDDITGGLALFSHLSVSAGSSEPSRAERFALEGTLRKSGKRIRANIKLVDCTTSAHVWAEQFDRDLGAGDVFAAQDELTDRIVATLAEPSGVLTRSLVALVKKKSSSNLSADECVLRTFGYLQQWRRDEHEELRTALEHGVEREPDHANAWACLSLLYLDVHRLYFNPRPKALDRSLRVAQRAVVLDPTSQLAHRAMAEAHYFRRDLGAFRSATKRVLMLNPRDTSCIGMVAMLMAFSGDWEHGKSIASRAMAMNPHHAEWFYFLFFWEHYRHRDYDKALEATEKMNMPGYPWTHGSLAIAHAQLGHTEAAKRHLNDFLALSPQYAKIARVDLSKWFVSQEYVEHILEGLAKAGLDVEEVPLAQIP